MTDESLNRMKVYSIDKGRHRSGMYFRPSYKPYEISYNVMFLNGTDYIEKLENLKKFSKDWNKLFGVSFLWHHNNSIRIGWRYDTDSDLIQLCLYLYNKGKRIIHPLSGMVREGEFLTVTLKFGYRSNTVTAQVVNHSDSRSSEIKVKGFDYPLIKLGYRLFPYCGGNIPALKEVHIGMSETTK